GQAALEQQVHAAAHQHTGGEHEDEGGADVDHRGPPSELPSSAGRPSSAVSRGESNATSGAEVPAASPCRSTSAPRVRRMSSISPTTTRNTPTSNTRVETTLMSPKMPAWISSITDCSTVPPNSSGITPPPADRN